MSDRNETETGSVADSLVEEIARRRGLDRRHVRRVLIMSASRRAATPVRSRRGWSLHPQVALRPEPFGALLYHFGTRKLSFLKNRTIVAVVEVAALDMPDARSALRRRSATTTAARMRVRYARGRLA